MVKKEKAKSKLKIIGIVLLVIILLLELLCSKYFMLFLIIPIVILIRNCKLLNRTSYYQDCQFDFEFDNNCFKLKIYDLPEELCNTYIIDYEDIEHICFYENGKFEMVCSNLQAINEGFIEEKTFCIKLDVDDSIMIEDKIMSYLNH